MRWLVLVVFVASCGASFEDMCQHDCEESRACYIEVFGVTQELAQASVSDCVENCMALEESRGYVLENNFHECSDEYSCGWVECVSE